MATYFEFFAGGGMARTGLGSEWQCLWANDISEKKGAAYSSNWGSTDLLIGDVFNVNAHDLPGYADMAWGSFPCQDLSLAGNGDGLNGDKSSAFWGFWKLIRGLKRSNRQPRMVVLENVYGTLTSHEGKDFEQIAQAVAREGYIFGALVIDAVHFVPQSRPRLFIIGIHADMAIPNETYTSNANPAWHPDAVIRAYNRLPKKTKAAWRWWSPPSPTNRVSTLDDIIEYNQSSVRWHTTAETQQLLGMMSELNKRKVLAAQRQGSLKVGTIYRRTRNGVQRAEVRFDGIAGCLRTPTGGSSRQTIMIVNGHEIKSRLISPREAARLMGLPDSYLLPDRYNDAYHLLGDGVVVPVVSHLSKHILLPIFKLNEELGDIKNQRQA